MTEEIRAGHVISIEETPPPAGAGIVAAAPTDPVLRINGEEVPYVRNEEGYHIYYQPPEPSLIGAARSFVDTKREKEQ